MRTHLAAALRRLADRVDPPTPHTYTLTFSPTTSTTVGYPPYINIDRHRSA